MVFDNLYIHVPFCRNKCDYCCFYSEPAAEPAAQTAYLKQLEEQLQNITLAQPLETLYIGGGTPTFLPPERLEQLFTMLRKYLPLNGTTEVSLECNPATITADNAVLIKDFANRISIGVQSFDQKKRAILGRQVSDREIYRAIELLAGDNLNLDLIYAIPGQSLTDWQQELRLALQYNIQHLSCYSLTLEEGTALAKRQEMTIDDDNSAAMWESISEIVATAGLERYEISNYARPKKCCRHNMNIWHGKAYLGLGPGAASFDGVKRWIEPASLTNWLQGGAPEEDIISVEARNREVLTMGLRTVDGWSKSSWQTTALPEPFSWKQVLKITHSADFIQTAEQVKLRPAAMLFWDNIAEEIIINE